MQSPSAKGIIKSPSKNVWDYDSTTSGKKQKTTSQINTNKAIPLVFVDESDGVTLRVSELATKLFSKRSSAKIAVVSIFGDVNSGKSYLLN